MKTQTLTIGFTMAAALAVALPTAAQPSTYTPLYPTMRDYSDMIYTERHPSFVEQDAAARAKEEAAREKERAQREKEREYSYYDQGQSALDNARWDRAVASFDRVVEQKGTKADAALYWKAYAQNKLGQRPEALGSINALIKDYPKSRYLSDARALEVEVKNQSGDRVNPSSESDEDIKLVAIQALANNPSD